MRLARNIGILALVALALMVVPGGGPVVSLVLTLLLIAFLTAIAMLGYRLYREHRWTLESLDERHRLVLYGAIGLALVTFAASDRLFELGLLGLLAWVALLGLCSYGAFWVYTRHQRYG